MSSFTSSFGNYCTREASFSGEDFHHTEDLMPCSTASTQNNQFYEMLSFDDEKLLGQSDSFSRTEKLVGKMTSSMPGFDLEMRV